EVLSSSRDSEGRRRNKKTRQLGDNVPSADSGYCQPGIIILFWRWSAFGSGASRSPRSGGSLSDALQQSCRWEEGFAALRGQDLRCDAPEATTVGLDATLGLPARFPSSRGSLKKVALSGPPAFCSFETCTNFPLVAGFST